MKRRHFLRNSAALLSSTLPITSILAAENEVSALNDSQNGFPAARLLSETKILAPIDASPDRIIAMNVCTRPFRALGPRIEAERLGRRTVVHNYGHGGSGWSLSWGSADVAVNMARDTGRNQVAVIGCGAIGLTSAITAQRAGMDVTIYAKERPPYVRSSFATGAWTPDSRICTKANAADFADRWEAMARHSYRRFQNLLGLPGNPIEWRDMYGLSDKPFDQQDEHDESDEPDYPDFVKDLLGDITPSRQDISALSHPFPARYVRRNPILLFNISAYSRLLIEEFTRGGGHIETVEFHDRGDITALDERTIINCTGYGARDLLGDESITPVRGQTAKLIPQPEVDYGISYGDRKVTVYPRRDGLLVQSQAEGDFGNAQATIDPAESISAVARLAEITAAMEA